MKTLLLFLCVLLSARSSWAQSGSSIFGQAISSTGVPAAYSTVRVCPYTGGGNPCSPLSSLYSDPDLSVPVSNPYTTDAYGNYSFFVTGGSYYLVQLAVSGATYSYLVSAAGTGSGSVSSVGLAMPSIFTVTNSPVTGTGTLTATFNSQAANLVFASPNGTSGSPIFRSLVAADIPPLSYVTSVGMTVPSIFTLSGSPITGSGVLALDLQPQSAHYVWAGPTSGTAVPSFRQLSYSDLSGTPPTPYYQTFSFNGTAATQAATANFSSLFTFANVSGQTNIGLNVTGTQSYLATAGAAGTSGNCVQWNALGGVGDSGAPCGTGSSTINPATRYSAPYYSAAGSASYLSGIIPAWASGTFVYAWRSTGTSVAPVATQLTQDDILAGFSINSFNFNSVTCTTCELGQTVNSPVTFTASYSATPSTATVSDGTNTVSMTPSSYTTGSLAYSYPLTTETSDTFTLAAVSTSTKTATLGINWYPRSFGGTGTGGSATGATASGTSAVLVGATGTLANGGLSNSSVGQVYTTTTSGTQYVYLLLVTNVSNPGGGSFTTPGPSVFPMNAPSTITFTNQYAKPVTMYLYRSVNSFFTGTTNVITVGN